MKRSQCLASRPHGFALVTTVSLMVLLAVLSVALLGLSTVSMRSSMLTRSQAEAQANARLAMMIAIGELQKSLGPDQRISARAGILDSKAETTTVDDVAHPQYLGVWDSWNTWLTDKKGSLSIRDTYKRGRDPSLFRGWLASHPDADRMDSVITGGSVPDAVTLCGKGSTGPDAAKHVQVARVGIATDGRLTGKYAWWISDESQKVRLDLKARDDASTIENARVLASHTGRMGIEKMTGMSDFDTTPAAIEKMISTGQAMISEPDAIQHFHDMTAFSLGLHTDVRSGGFKRDLNLAFEAEKPPVEMDAARLFGNRPFDAPIRPMTGELSKTSPRNPYVAPMSWRNLRENYRLYREFPGSAMMRPVEWDRGKPYTRRFLMGRTNMMGRWDMSGYSRLPVMLRQSWIIATKTEANPNAQPDQRDYYVLAVPVVSLWNPYNVSMYVDSEEISYMGSMFYSIPLVQRTYRGGTFLGETRFPDESSVWGNARPNGAITNNQLGYRMIPTEKSGLIKFDPGQVRVFSTDDEVLDGVRLLDDPAAMNSRHFFASPGYKPVQETNSNIMRGLKCRVHPGTSTQGQGPLAISLRLAVSDRHYDPYYIATSRKSALCFSFHEWRSAKHGVYFENGSLVGYHEWHDVVRQNIYSVDWLRDREVDTAWIVRDEPANRAMWPAPGSPPLPIGIVSVMAKSPENLKYAASGGFSKDFRNRGWLHSPATGMGTLLMNPDDLNRADSPYQLHFTAVNGDQEVSEYLQADGVSGFYGGGYTPARGQTHVPALGLPVAPITNIASFSAVRVDPARARLDQKDDRRAPSAGLPGRGYHNMKHLAHPGAAFGAGVGNAYAHPMIDPQQVYTRNDFGVDPGWDGQLLTTNIAICDDYWDHLFLANEELWDSWFCSGIAPLVRTGKLVAPKKTVARDFFSYKPSLLPKHFQPYPRGKTAEQLADLAEDADKQGWNSIASHILNKGQFNVNSTSKEAWKALFMSLADRPIALLDAKTSVSSIVRDKQEIGITRLSPVNGALDSSDPAAEGAWRGIRKLSDGQIDKLAEEMVRQVKLRGPFLNMAEFINRRLSNDDLGVVGAIQAAIDWDEFNAGYDGNTSGTGESINRTYKNGDDMIGASRLPANYPNPKAATGSRYAGIPGYIMQSDLLQGFGSSLAARGDTFLVRAYGESLNSDGKVAAKAWCEAVVQRLPEYVDPADEADKLLRDPAVVPGADLDLNAVNRAFGRQFKIVSFRWLNQDEV